MSGNLIDKLTSQDGFICELTEKDVVIASRQFTSKDRKEVVLQLEDENRENFTKHLTTIYDAIKLKIMGKSVLTDVDREMLQLYYYLNKFDTESYTQLYDTTKNASKISIDGKDGPQTKELILMINPAYYDLGEDRDKNAATYSGEQLQTLAEQTSKNIANLKVMKNKNAIKTFAQTHYSQLFASTYFDFFDIKKTRTSSLGMDFAEKTVGFNFQGCINDMIKKIQKRATDQRTHITTTAEFTTKVKDLPCIELNLKTNCDAAAAVNEIIQRAKQTDSIGFVAKGKECFKQAKQQSSFSEVESLTAAKAKKALVTYYTGLYIESLATELQNTRIKNNLGSQEQMSVLMSRYQALQEALLDLKLKPEFANIKNDQKEYNAYQNKIEKIKQDYPRYKTPKNLESDQKDSDQCQVKLSALSETSGLTSVEISQLAELSQLIPDLTPEQFKQFFALQDKASTYQKLYQEISSSYPHQSDYQTFVGQCSQISGPDAKCMDRLNRYSQAQQSIINKSNISNTQLAGIQNYMKHLQKQSIFQKLQDGQQLLHILDDATTDRSDANPFPQIAQDNDKKNKQQQQTDKSYKIAGEIVWNRNPIGMVINSINALVPTSKQYTDPVAKFVKSTPTVVAGFVNGLSRAVVDTITGIDLILLNIGATEGQKLQNLKIKQHLDQLMKMPKSTDMQKPIFDSDGKRNGNRGNVMSGVGEQSANMLCLIYGGGLIAKGVKTGVGLRIAGMSSDAVAASTTAKAFASVATNADKIGLVTSSLLMQTPTMYAQAYQSGMRGMELRGYTFAQAGIGSVLELFSPNKMLSSSLGLSQLPFNIKQLLASDTGKQSIKTFVGQFVKSLATEIGSENIQELSQGAVEKLINSLSEKTAGDAHFTLQDFKTTIFLTTLTTGLMSSHGASAQAKSGASQDALLAYIAKDASSLTSTLQALETEIKKGGDQVVELQKLKDQLVGYLSLSQTQNTENKTASKDEQRNTDGNQENGPSSPSEEMFMDVDSKKSEVEQAMNEKDELKFTEIMSGIWRNRSKINKGEFLSQIKKIGASYASEIKTGYMLFNENIGKDNEKAYEGFRIMVGSAVKAGVILFQTIPLPSAGVGTALLIGLLVTEFHTKGPLYQALTELYNAVNDQNTHSLPGETVVLELQDQNQQDINKEDESFTMTSPKGESIDFTKTEQTLSEAQQGKIYEVNNMQRDEGETDMDFNTRKLNSLCELFTDDQIRTLAKIKNCDIDPNGLGKIVEHHITIVAKLIMDNIQYSNNRLAFSEIINKIKIIKPIFDFSKLLFLVPGTKNKSEYCKKNGVELWDDDLVKVCNLILQFLNIDDTFDVSTLLDLDYYKLINLELTISNIQRDYGLTLEDIIFTFNTKYLNNPEIYDKYSYGKFFTKVLDLYKEGKIDKTQIKLVFDNRDMYYNLKYGYNMQSIRDYHTRKEAYLQQHNILSKSDFIVLFNKETKEKSFMQQLQALLLKLIGKKNTPSKYNRAEIYQKGLGYCYAYTANELLKKENYFEVMMRTSLKIVDKNNWTMRLPLGDPNGKVIKISRNELQKKFEVNGKAIKAVSGSSLGFQIMEIAFIKYALIEQANLGNKDYSNFTQIIEQYHRDGDFEITGDQLMFLEGGWTEEVLDLMLGGVGKKVKVRSLDMEHIKSSKGMIQVVPGKPQTDNSLVTITKERTDGYLEFTIQGVKDANGKEYNRWINNHAYSIEKKYQDKDGNRQFVIINPRDTGRKILMNEEQFKLVFQWFSVYEVDIDKLFQNK